MVMSQMVRLMWTGDTFDVTCEQPSESVNDK